MNQIYLTYYGFNGAPLNYYYINKNDKRFEYHGPLTYIGKGLYKMVMSSKYFPNSYCTVYLRTFKDGARLTDNNSKASEDCVANMAGASWSFLTAFKNDYLKPLIDYRK